MGMLLPELPEAFGGADATLAHQLAIQEEYARAEVPASPLVHCLVAHYLLDCGTDEQRERWLPRMATGELFAGIAMTEPGAGSDLQAIRTCAVRDGDDYVINGAKTSSPTATAATCWQWSARPTPPSAPRASPLIVVETEGLAGFRVGPHPREDRQPRVRHLRTVLRRRARARRESDRWHRRPGLRATDEPVAVRTHADRGGRSGEPSNARWNSRSPTRRNAAPSASRCSSFRTPASSSRNARPWRTWSAASSTTVFSASSTARSRPEAAYMAKWWCTEQQRKVLDECLQLFGGYGYMAEYPIARMYADARVQKIYGGANEVMKELIARRL